MSVSNLWCMNSKKSHLDFLKINHNTTTNALLAADISPTFSSQFGALIEVASLNSRVILEAPKGFVGEVAVDDKAVEQAKTPSGDATELGLYRFFSQCVQQQLGVEMEQFREANPKVHEVPFNSSNKWQMSIHSMAVQGGKQCLFLKGAPDVLMKKCSHYLHADGKTEVPIDEVRIILFTFSLSTNL